MKSTRIFAILMCFAMVLGMFSMTALGAPTATEKNAAGSVLGAASIVPTASAVTYGAVFDFPVYQGATEMEHAHIDTGSVTYTKDGLTMGNTTSQWRYCPNNGWTLFDYGHYVYAKFKVEAGGSLLGKFYLRGGSHCYVKFVMTENGITLENGAGVLSTSTTFVPGTDWVEMIFRRQGDGQTWWFKGGNLTNWTCLASSDEAWINGSNNVGLTFYGNNNVVNYCAVVEASDTEQKDPVYVDSIEDIMGTQQVENIYDHQITADYNHKDAHKYSDDSGSYGEAIYTDDGLALPSDTVSTIWYLDPEEYIWEGVTATVMKGKLGVTSDSTQIYITSPFYDKTRVKVDVKSGSISAIAGNPAATSTDMTYTTAFDFGTEWFEILIHSKMDGYNVYAKNETTDGKWCLLLECTGYQYKAPSVGYLGITGNTDNADKPVLIKSLSVYKAKRNGQEGEGRTDIELGGGIEGTGIKNIAFGLGADSSQRNLTWFSERSDVGVVTWQKADELVDGEFTAAARTATAIRDSNSIIYTGGTHYNNKAVMTGLEPDTKYYYRLSNGEDKTGLIPFKTGSNTASFSFAYVADAQIGSGPQINQTVEEDGKAWGRTLNQFVTDPVFEGIEFIMSGGDQINSDTTAPGTTNVYDHPQYDNYFDHPEMRSIANVGVLGNHDNYANGGHYLHYYEPNLDRNSGNSYNYADAYDGSDYYFVYDSMLCVVLNINSFNYDTGKLGSAEVDAQHQAEAAEHIAFIKRVLEETKDNKEILWKVILQHQSPYGGSYHNNYTFTNANATGYVRPETWVNMNLRKYLLPAYYELGFDLVLSGHDHTYTRTHILKPATDENGKYTTEAIISPYANHSGRNYYTYADGTTTPTYVDWTDLNGTLYSDLKVSSTPVKVTDPDGVLYVTGSSASGAYCNDNIAPNHYAAVSLGHEAKLKALGFDSGIRRQAVKIDVTPKTLTITNYGLGGTKWDADPSYNVLDTFTIEKTVPVSVSKIDTTENSWHFEISAVDTMTGGKVYLGAFDSQERLVGMSMVDVAEEDSVSITMEKPDVPVAYFKAFIWKENLKPLSETGYLSNN